MTSTNVTLRQRDESGAAVCARRLQPAGSASTALAIINRQVTGAGSSGEGRAGTVEDVEEPQLRGEQAEEQDGEQNNDDDNSGRLGSDAGLEIDQPSDSAGPHGDNGSSEPTMSSDGDAQVDQLDYDNQEVPARHGLEATPRRGLEATQDSHPTDTRNVGRSPGRIHPGETVAASPARLGGNRPLHRRLSFSQPDLHRVDHPPAVPALSGGDSVPPPQLGARRGRSRSRSTGCTHVPAGHVSRGAPSVVVGPSVETIHEDRRSRNARNPDFIPVTVHWRGEKRKRSHRSRSRSAGPRGRSRSSSRRRSYRRHHSRSRRSPSRSPCSRSRSRSHHRSSRSSRRSHSRSRRHRSHRRRGYSRSCSSDSEGERISKKDRLWVAADPYADEPEAPALTATSFVLDWVKLNLNSFWKEKIPLWHFSPIIVKGLSESERVKPSSASLDTRIELADRLLIARYMPLYVAQEHIQPGQTAPCGISRGIASMIGAMFKQNEARDDFVTLWRSYLRYEGAMLDVWFNQRWKRVRIDHWNADVWDVIREQDRTLSFRPSARPSTSSGSFTSSSSSSSLSLSSSASARPKKLKPSSTSPGVCWKGGAACTHALGQHAASVSDHLRDAPNGGAYDRSDSML